MTEMAIKSPAKMGVRRVGKRITITIEFPDDYAAMHAFDVWSNEDIAFAYCGPKVLSEADEHNPKMPVSHSPRDERMPLIRRVAAGAFEYAEFGAVLALIAIFVALLLG